MHRTAPLLLLAIALAACSSDERATPVAAPSAPPAAAPTASASTFEYDAPPVAEVGNVCNFRTRKDPVMQGYRDRTGSAWEGEVRVRDVASMDTKWFTLSDKRVATIVARPRVDKFRLRVDANCYNAETKTYAGCNKVLEADLSPIRGFARGLTIPQARALAIQLCEKKVADVVNDTLSIRQDNVDLRCRVIEQTFCELPPAPTPPPATAKKK